MDIEQIKYYFRKSFRILLILLFLLIFFAFGLLAFTILSGGGPPITGQISNMVIAPFVPVLILIIFPFSILFYKLISPSKNQKKWALGIGLMGIILTGIFTLPFISIPLSQIDHHQQFSTVFGEDWNKFDSEIEASFYQTPFNLIYTYFGAKDIENDVWDSEIGLIYKNTSDYTLKYDVYYPGPEANIQIGKYSTIIYVHGGGWAIGERNMAATRHKYFASQGYVVFTIDYRLCDIKTSTMIKEESGLYFPILDQINRAPDSNLVGDFTIEDMMIDLGNFTQFLADNEGKTRLHGADLDHVFLFGQSAGSHLAGLMAFGYNDDLSNPKWGLSENLIIRGAVLFYPPNNARRFFYEDHQFYYDAGFTKDKTPSDDPNFYDLYTPSQHIDENDPPCILFHGTSDSMVPIENSYEIFTQCEKNQIDCILVENPFVGHAYDFSPSLRIMSTYYMERWLYLTNIQ